MDPNNIEIDKKSYKNILIYHIGYVVIKDLKYKSINSVNPFYLFFNNEINENKYLMLVPTTENKEITKKIWRTME